MDMNIDELWLDLPRVRNRKDNIVTISNTGKYRRRDGTVGIFGLRQRVTGKGDRRTAKRCYHLIAEHFLITVIRPDQNCIDHITHHPKEYNVNDVRNLRWCTIAENNGFEEARENTSKSMKIDDVGPMGAYHRAKKLYKEGELTEDEFQQYRDAKAEYIRARNKQTSLQSSVNPQD